MLVRDRRSSRSARRLAETRSGPRGRHSGAAPAVGARQAARNARRNRRPRRKPGNTLPSPHPPAAGKTCRHGEAPRGPASQPLPNCPERARHAVAAAPKPRRRRPQRVEEPGDRAWSASGAQPGRRSPASTMPAKVNARPSPVTATAACRRTDRNSVPITYTSGEQVEVYRFSMPVTHRRAADRALSAGVSAAAFPVLRHVRPAVAGDDLFCHGAAQPDCPDCSRGRSSACCRMR